MGLGVTGAGTAVATISVNSLRKYDANATTRAERICFHPLQPGVSEEVKQRFIQTPETQRCLTQLKDMYLIDQSIETGTYKLTGALGAVIACLGVAELVWSSILPSKNS